MPTYKTSQTISDVRQLNIFDLKAEADKLLTVDLIPNEPTKEKGSVNVDQLIRQTLNQTIIKSDKARAQIAAELSELVGRKVTKATLDTYTGASRPNRLPADLLPALTIVLGPHLLEEISLSAGCKVMTREEVILANAGKVIYIEEFLKRKKEEYLSELPTTLGAMA